MGRQPIQMNWRTQIQDSRQRRPHEQGNHRGGAAGQMLRLRVLEPQDQRRDRDVRQPRRNLLSLGQKGLERARVSGQGEGEDPGVAVRQQQQDRRPRRRNRLFGALLRRVDYCFGERQGNLS